MGMQDRDWYRAEKRQERRQDPKPEPVRRARPVFFVHYLAGFWPGAIAGLIVGFALGVFF